MSWRRYTFNRLFQKKRHFHINTTSENLKSCVRHNTTCQFERFWFGRYKSLRFYANKHTHLCKNTWRVLFLTIAAVLCWRRSSTNPIIYDVILIANQIHLWHMSIHWRNTLFWGCFLGTNVDVLSDSQIMSFVIRGNISPTFGSEWNSCTKGINIETKLQIQLNILILQHLFPHIQLFQLWKHHHIYQIIKCL